MTARRDEVARDLYDTLCHFRRPPGPRRAVPLELTAAGRDAGPPASSPPGPPAPSWPSWEDLDGETREAWSQVADRAAEVAVDLEDAVADAGKGIDRSVTVSVDTKRRGPKFDIHAEVIDGVAVVKVAPTHTRIGKGAVDWKDVDPLDIAFVSQYPKTSRHAGPNAIRVDLYDLLGVDTYNVSAISNVGVDFEVGGETTSSHETRVSTVKMPGIDGSFAVDDSDARAFLTGDV